MIWIPDKELSILFMLAVLLKKHIFYFHTYSYKRKTFQHRLVLQTLLYAHRQFPLIARQRHWGSGTRAFQKHVESAKKDFRSLATDSSAVTPLTPNMTPVVTLLSLTGALIMVLIARYFSCLYNSTGSIECSYQSEISSGQPFFFAPLPCFLLFLCSSVGLGYAILKLLNIWDSVDSSCFLVISKSIVCILEE